MSTDWQELAYREHEAAAERIRARLAGHEETPSRLELRRAMGESTDAVVAPLKAIVDAYSTKFASVACRGDAENLGQCFHLVERDCPLRNDLGCPKRHRRFSTSLQQSGRTPLSVATDAGVPHELARVVLEGRLVETWPALVGARTWWRNLERKRVLVLFGASQTGKSTAGAELAISAGGLFIHLPTLTMSQAGSEAFATLMRASPLVVFDDLGAEPLGFDGELVTRVAGYLCARVDAGALTVATTNTPSSIRERYQERVAHRFNRAAHLVAA